MVSQTLCCTFVESFGWSVSLLGQGHQVRTMRLGMSHFIGASLGTCRALTSLYDNQTSAYRSPCSTISSQDGPGIWLNGSDTPTSSSSLTTSQVQKHRILCNAITRIQHTHGRCYDSSYILLPMADNVLTFRTLSLCVLSPCSCFPPVPAEPIKLEVDQIYHLACPASPPHYQVGLHSTSSH